MRAVQSRIDSAGPRKEGGAAPAASRAPVWLLGSAAIWSVGLVVAGLVVPLYSTSSSTAVNGSTGSTGSIQVRAGPSATLLQVNGMKVLVLLGIPLAVVVLVAGALRLRRRHLARWPGFVAWTLAGVLDCFAILGLMTIGPFVAPVAGLVTVACALS